MLLAGMQLVCLVQVHPLLASIGEIKRKYKDGEGLWILINGSENVAYMAKYD